MKNTVSINNQLKKIFTLIFILFGFMPMANATVIALDSTRMVGNQGWNGSLGMHFDVFSPINVTHLGAFDSLQDGFSSLVSVGIFDRNTQMLVTEIASFNGTNESLMGQSRFFDIVDVVLGIGDYAIVAQGFNSSNPNGNAAFGGAVPTIDTGSGLISFVGGGFYNATPTLDYPLIVDGGPANRYDAGTFKFEAVNNVPTPTTVCLLGIGLIGVFRMRIKASKFPVLSA